MLFKITYDGKYKDFLYVRGKTLKEIGIQVNKELKKRNWERENCYSEQIED